LPEYFNEDFFVGLSLVLVTNIVLSGDNAVVIAMAARTLEGYQRRQAIFWGAIGAVVLRLVFAVVVTYVLSVPLLQAAGGILLVWIAWRLVHDEGSEEADKVEAGTSVWDAIRIIIVADAVMSLDNVVALVGAARGDFLLLAIGIATTIPLVIFGAALLAFFLERFPVLVYVGSALLVYIAVEMFFEDIALRDYLEPYAGAESLMAGICAVVFLAVAWLWTRHLTKVTRIREGANKP
jgi:YjbE family integral membrane protein